MHRYAEMSHDMRFSATDAVSNPDVRIQSNQPQVAMTAATPRPDLYSYLYHRKWLADWFDWKKASNPRFSHRMFARLAGQRSPSLLLLVCQGKRNLTAASTEGFVKATGLNDEEARFFRLLVELDGAAATEDRNLVFERIAGTQRFQAARRLEGESFRYLSCWYLPAIR